MFQTPELIITDELKDLLYSDKDCTAIRIPFLHKKYRRDAELKKEFCPACNAGISGTKEGQKGCPYCKGDGYLWDEVIQTGWFFRPNIRTAISSMVMASPVGRDLNKETRLLTSPEVFIYEGDVVYDIKIDENKKIAIPLLRQEEYFCYFSERYASNQTNSEFNVAGLRI